ncbi:MAG: Rid family hydrolase [Acidobacteriia bacterium]|nr:Rid family hydrolase [Terriglobia bacterium]
MVKKTGKTRKAIQLPRPISGLPFSDAIVVGNTVYLSGRIGFDPKTGFPPPAIEREVHLLMDGFAQVLAVAKMKMDDLVYVQVFCPDLSLYDEFNAIYRTYFKNDLPARAFIGSGPLLRGGHFEMIGVAVKP